MNIYIFAPFFALFILMASGSSAQTENFVSVLVHQKQGASVSFKDGSHFFRFVIEGKNVKSVAENGPQKYVDVDGRILQYLLVPFPEKIDYKALSVKKKRNFLLDYEGYEMESIKQSLNVKNLNEKLQYLNLKGREFLFWFYDMPKNKEGFRQQCYLITVCYDNILVLNCPSDGNMLDAREFLLKLGNSLIL